MQAVTLEEAWGPLERLLLWAITPGSTRENESEGSYISLYNLVYCVCLGTESLAVALRRRVGLLFAVHCRSVADLLSRCEALRSVAGKKIVIDAPDSDLPRKKELLNALGSKLPSVDASAEQVLDVYRELWEVYKNALKILWGVFSPLDKALFADSTVDSMQQDRGNPTYSRRHGPDSVEGAMEQHEARVRASNPLPHSVPSLRDTGASLPDAQSPLVQIGLVAWRTHVMDKIGPYLIDLTLDAIQSSREARGQRRSLPDLHMSGAPSVDPPLHDAHLLDLSSIRAIVDSLVTIGRGDAFASAISDPVSFFSTSVGSLGRFWGEEQVNKHLARFKEDFDTPASDEQDIQTLQLYITRFQKLYLHRAARFYTREAQVLMDALSTREYVTWVTNKIFNSEISHSAQYLHPRTVADFCRILERTLISDHLTSLQQGLQAMLPLGDDACSDLAAVFSLLSRVPNGTKTCADCFRAHAEFIGSQKTKVFKVSGQDYLTFVDLFAEIYQQFRGLVDQAFQSEPTLLLALDHACTRIVNGARFAPELVARYTHALMDINGPIRKQITQKFADSEEAQSEAVVKAVEKTTRLFRFLGEKDVFEKLFSAKLAKRLLFRTFASIEDERMLVMELQDCCGPEYVTHLQRMLSDMTVSISETSLFRKDSDEIEKIKLEVSLLSTAAWPIVRPPADIGVPEELSREQSWHDHSQTGLSSITSSKAYSALIQKVLVSTLPITITGLTREFNNFYCKRYDGRKLTWLHTLARVELRAMLGSMRSVCVEATLIQAAVLLLFNTTSMCTEEEIRQRLEIETVHLPHLQLIIDVLVESGLCNRYPTGAIAVNDSFSLSTVKGQRLRLFEKLSNGLLASDPETVGDRSGMVDMDEFSSISPELTSHSDQAVMDRRYSNVRRSAEDSRRTQLQAFLVRIMKRRQRVSHQNLMAELLDHVAKFSLGWSVPTVEVKQSIDILIEREYIERDPSDSAIYIYVA